MIRRRILAVVLVAVLLVVGAAGAATIRIINGDGPNEGLNDATPAEPLGGNDGVTVGEQRRKAVVRAAEIWASVIESPVEIEVELEFNPLPCDDESGVLGQASPNSVHSDFSGAPLADTFYAAALANRLAGLDLCPPSSCRTSADLSAQFNSRFGTSCAFTGSWYYGLDANPPPRGADLVTVALHELGHGLGFLSFADVRGGRLFMGMDDAYSNWVEDHDLGETFATMNDSERAAAIVSPGDLHFTGPSVIAASDRLGSGVGPRGHVHLYAPSPLEPGSSLSHIDVTASPNELMEPVIRSAVHDVGLALEVFRDLGWQVHPGPCAGDCDGDLRVGAAELVLAVRVALREAAVVQCRAADSDDSGAVGIGDLIRGVGSSLNGCGGIVVESAAARASGVSSGATCRGDCNGDGRIGVEELVRAVNIAVGRAELATCAAIDGDGDGRVAINELITAVRRALDGCFCPFDFLDDGAGAEQACVFAGRWNSECGDAGLPATFGVEQGLLGVAVVTGIDSPPLNFFAQPTGALDADLVGFMIGDEVVQLTGTIQLSDDGRQLTIAPDTDPEILIEECPFARYDALFDRIVSTSSGGATGRALRSMAADRILFDDNAMQ